MQWRDCAVVLAVNKFGERAAVIHVLTKQHGIYAGVARNAFSKSQRANFIVGNVVQARWNARLSEHLGNINCELIDNIAAFIMADAKKLYGLQSICALLHSCFAERDPHPTLYAALYDLLQLLKQPSSNAWLAAYVRMELLILRESGFQLELQQCAVTGKSNELVYVSPKSGRAVSAGVGMAYHDKLLPLPEFLLTDCKTGVDNIENASILDGMRLTGYFLKKRILEPHGITNIAARDRLLRYIKNSALDIAQVNGDGFTLSDMDCGSGDGLLKSNKMIKA